jgi:nitroimidazol reductase NimA-like FMN-containing flavoprotein (pyridoxamine 5'-phosphate oxidase superfamily)
MRRAEFAVNDEVEFGRLMERIGVGVLSLADEPCPHSVPLNFVYLEGALYFHGASAGRKYELARRGVGATFAAYEEYSLIPSYFINPTNPCGATQFFASVSVEGTVELVDEIGRKGEILDALMMKYQGGAPSKSLESCSAVVAKTALFRLSAQKFSLKIKVGQNMKNEDFERVVECLKKRGEPIDKKTVEMMKKFRK